MKKRISTLPLEAVLKTAKTATQNAALNAVNAGRTVIGWKDGNIVRYGPDLHSLQHKLSTEDKPYSGKL